MCPVQGGISRDGDWILLSAAVQLNPFGAISHQNTGNPAAAFGLIPGAFVWPALSFFTPYKTAFVLAG